MCYNSFCIIVTVSIVILFETRVLSWLAALSRILNWLAVLSSFIILFTQVIVLIYIYKLKRVTEIVTSI